MPKYEIKFERIGRNKDVPPLVAQADGVVNLGMLIADYADQYIMSEDFEVGVNDDLTGGHILVGMAHCGGEFTITEV